MLGRNCLSAMALAALATVMASVAVAQTTTFSRQPALAVPDNTSVSDSMVISGVAGNISTLTLELRINHTWDADLNIYLIPPGTTWAGPYTGVPPANVVEICTGNGGSGDNFGTGTTPPFVYTRFSSATDPLNPGTIAITAGTASFTAGVYTPEGTAAFGALYGTNPNGTWTLALADTASGDAGLVLEWRLIVSDTAGDPEINVQQPAGTNRTSGSIVSLGSTVAGIAQNLTFTVQNIGATQNLNVTSISGAATGVANCTVTTGALTPASPIAPAGSSTFGVTVTPTAAGPFECTVTISNNDANEGTYTILIQGVGESVTSTFPYTQTFETFPLDITNPVPLPAASNWVNLTNDGGVQDWYVDSGGTPSANTGPAVDHTLGTAAGIYLYVEDSNTPQGEVNLLTPWFNLSGLVAPVASFWVHANDANAGANDNTLHIDVINATTSTTDLDVITPIGHVADATLTVWTRVNIALAAYVGNTIRIRFRLEDNGGSFSHDVAIDDFDLRDFPEMDVQRPASTSIASGGTDNVGGVLTTGANFVYTIANTGGAVLNLTGTAPNYVVVTPGTGTPTVSVTVQPANTVAASGSVTFTINVVPAAGAFDFAVSIANDDPNENPYTFTVSGTGVTNAPPVLALGSPTDFTAG
ncbi:MAG TPA: hypothetical protein PLF37_11775, partial [Planctomycetota bacterium]|nr:hypothetical protein [Planctomycetota bacterium]